MSNIKVHSLPCLLRYVMGWIRESLKYTNRTLKASHLGHWSLQFTLHSNLYQLLESIRNHSQYRDTILFQRIKRRKFGQPAHQCIYSTIYNSKIPKIMNFAAYNTWRQKGLLSHPTMIREMLHIKILYQLRIISYPHHTIVSYLQAITFMQSKTQDLTIVFSFSFVDKQITEGKYTITDIYPSLNHLFSSKQTYKHLNI